ncbi:MAG TPA: response regulator [Opitutaceae bacterium]|nr:response regulator [Opitutaceae bacterium]
MAFAPAPRPAILLLEDDTPLAGLIMAALENEFDVERAANVEEAVLLLGTRTFDLLVCDHMMPGKKQGLDFLVEAQERFPAAKRVLMTGYMNPDLISRSMAVAGLSACIMKPLRMDDLKTQLRKVLA